ncbi:MAG: hypothetical protein ACO3DL_08290 [Burkholderiaceae bacterium]|jgi:hypothetical protein
MRHLIIYARTRVAKGFSGASAKALLLLALVGLTTHASSNQALLACNLAKYNYKMQLAFDAHAERLGQWHCGTPRLTAYGDVEIACGKFESLRLSR